MLTIKNLSVGYDKKPVALIKNFSLGAGEHGLILGASGSGKSTLLYTLAGLLPFIKTKNDNATAMVDGNDLLTMTPRQADQFRGKTMGIIYQSLYLIRSLTVLDNLLAASYAAGLKQDQTHAKHLLRAVGIDNLADTKPDKLSLGQQQRVAIARAAITMPKIIFGDEPTSALDDNNCHGAMDLLLRVAQEAKASLLIATHDPRIKKYFDKTITL
ncbi:MAG: ATP-binding cassette domain-containing protein [Hydrotalea sp.]|nr:ATP-binding cassette domain-containing protein [Hydrotalea sp.]